MFIVNDAEKTYRAADVQPGMALPASERIWDEDGHPRDHGYNIQMVEPGNPFVLVGEWMDESGAAQQAPSLTAYDVDREELLFLEIQHVATQEHISRSARLTRIRELVEALAK